jgi:hypothetical protein
MSEIAFTIRDATSAIHAHIHGSRTDYLVAALSADPETIPELQAALKRYLPGEAASFFQHWHSGPDTQPWDAGVCVIDLAARLVVLQSTYSLPERTGGVTVRDHKGKEETIRYHLADDWLFTHHVDGCESLARKRRAEREANPPFDARPVLYDRVCEFIASRCATEPAVDTQQAEDRIRAIHADWLTTPRDDLRGAAPRDVLLKYRSHIGWQLQDRSEQWTVQHAAPPVLSKSSAAYRFAGFGTHENVIYYYLVRTLLRYSWDRVHAGTFAEVSGAIVSEAVHLRAVRDEWLNARNYEEFSGRTPAVMIEHERRRLPEAISGAEMVIDDDCPLCQMLADMPGPGFWHLDGCNMDDEFAFSWCRTQEEWEAKLREREEFNRKFNERWEAEKKRKTLWRSYVNNAAIGNSPTFAIYGFATYLTELVSDLKDASASQEEIAELNRRFGNIREVVDGADFSLIDPVIDRFSESLASLATSYPALADKCNDLDRQVREFGERLVEIPFHDDPQ